MTAAGVQNTDAAAYLPPPPSTSTPDARGTSAASKTADPQSVSTADEPADFQSELALQQTGAQDAKPPVQSGSSQAGPTQASPTQAGLTQTGSTRTDSSKTGKKRSALPDDANPAAVTPSSVAEPQKQILPFALAFARPQENAQPEENARPSEKIPSDEIAQATAQQAGQVLSSALAGISGLPELRQPVALKQSMKVRQSAADASARYTAASNAISAAAADPGKVFAQTLAPVSNATAAVPTGQDGKQSEDPSSQGEAVTSGKVGQPAEGQPVSLAGFKLPAAPAEPVASAVRDATDSAPSSPSALAFAARLAAVPQQAGQPAGTNPIQSPAVSGSQAAAQIPVRYAATAQIIQSAALGTQQDGPKKDPGDSSGRFARPDARTDMVVPRFEASSELAPGATAAPQQPAPTARPETIIEPPAAPPTSSHDIRVRVPDNNGGSTQVRFVESGGEVRVSVRTADESLAQNLRSHLNDLTQRLSDGGTAAEVWKPASNPASSSQNDQQQAQQDGRGSGGQGSGGQGGQQDRQQKRPAWLEEMESSLHGEQN